MDICTFQQSAYICTFFMRAFLCFFYCSAFITLLQVIKLTFDVYSIIRTNLRIFQIIIYYFFYVNINISNNNFNFFNSFNIYIFKRRFTFSHNIFLSILIFKAGDIELNPGAQKNPRLYFSCCHWNVSSLATSNFFKVLAVKAYKST